MKKAATSEDPSAELDRLRAVQQATGSAFVVLSGKNAGLPAVAAGAGAGGSARWVGWGYAGRGAAGGGGGSGSGRGRQRKVGKGSVWGVEGAHREKRGAAQGGGRRGSRSWESGRWVRGLCGGGMVLGARCGGPRGRRGQGTGGS